MSVSPLYVAMVLFGVGLLALAAYFFAGGPVSRRRVETFAQRQQLTITPANKDQVIRYLATTRRWRVTGFLVGLFASRFVGPQPGEISTGAEYITIFVGWFLGALVAEVGVAHPAQGPVPAASLRPRRPGRYVRRFAWALVPASAVVALVTAVVTVIAGSSGWGEPNWAEAGVWLGLALAVAAAVRLIQHAVLRRAQPLAAPDVIEADDAIRSRALHVLSGGGAALVLFLVLNELGAIHPVHTWDQSRITAIRVIGAFTVALAGWLVSTSIWPPPRSARRGDGAAIGRA